MDVYHYVYKSHAASLQPFSYDYWIRCIIINVYTDKIHRDILEKWNK